jgi:hypothetical protein
VGTAQLIFYSVERRSSCAGCTTSFLYDIIVTFARELIWKKLYTLIIVCWSPPIIIFPFLHCFIYILLLLLLLSYEHKGQQNLNSTSSLSSHIKTQHYQKAVCNWPVCCALRMGYCQHLQSGTVLQQKINTRHAGKQSEAEGRNCSVDRWRKLIRHVERCTFTTREWPMQCANGKNRNPQYN